MKPNKRESTQKECYYHTEKRQIEATKVHEEGLLEGRICRQHEIDYHIKEAFDKILPEKWEGMTYEESLKNDSMRLKAGQIEGWNACLERIKVNIDKFLK